MEVLAYDLLADHFNWTIHSGLVYDFSNVGFQLIDVPSYVNLTMQAKFCLILTMQAKFCLILWKPRFVDYSAIFTKAIRDDMVICKANNLNFYFQLFFNSIVMFLTYIFVYIRSDVVGVIYVGEVQHLQRYGRSRPTKDIALLIVGEFTFSFFFKKEHILIVWAIPNPFLIVQISRDLCSNLGWRCIPMSR